MKKNKKALLSWGSATILNKKDEDSEALEGLEEFPEGPEKEYVDVVDNHIYFYSGVTTERVKELNQEVLLMDKAHQKIQIEYDLPEPPPIHLHICSMGGELFSGLAGYSAVKNTKSPVYTYIEGNAASAATLISLAGNKKYMGKNSFILIHQLSGGFFGKYEEMKIEMKNKKTFMDSITQFYLDHTKIDKAFLKDLLKKDIWLKADRALELGLIDEIIE